VAASDDTRQRARGKELNRKKGKEIEGIWKVIEIKSTDEKSIHTFGGIHMAKRKLLLDSNKS